jgi:NitT/TauT family transport system substrate-binding protein
MANFISRRGALKVSITGAASMFLPFQSAYARTIVKPANYNSLPFTLALVTEAGGFFKKEGLETEHVVSNSGARSAQMLAAEQVHFVLGDSAHPLRLTEQGKPTVALFATDNRCTYANIVIRKELYDGGLKQLSQMLTTKPPEGNKWRAGCTSVGSGSWMYGNYVLKSVKHANGKSLNDDTEWLGLGATSTLMGGMKAGKVDVSIAAPEMMLFMRNAGWAELAYDVRTDSAWNGVFGGPVANVAGYALKSTTEKLKEETQLYVNAMYRASQWMKAAKSTEIASMLEPYRASLGVERDVIMASLDFYRPMWQYDLTYSKESYDNGQRVAAGLKAEKTFPYEQIVDLSFLRRAQSRG